MSETTILRGTKDSSQVVKKLINDVNETKVQGPLGLSYGIHVLKSIEGDLQLIMAMMFP